MGISLLLFLFFEENLDENRLIFGPGIKGPTLLELLAEGDDCDDDIYNNDYLNCW